MDVFPAGLKREAQSRGWSYQTSKDGAYLTKGHTALNVMRRGKKWFVEVGDSDPNVDKLGLSVGTAAYLLSDPLTGDRGMSSARRAARAVLSFMKVNESVSLDRTPLVLLPEGGEPSE